MNEISNEVIKHCQALEVLTRLPNDKLISITMMRGKTEILFMGAPSAELLVKCKNITSETMEEDAPNILTVRHTAEYAPDIELHWYEYKEMNEKI